jgi:hypothetical protein
MFISILLGNAGGIEIGSTVTYIVTEMRELA